MAQADEILSVRDELIETRKREESEKKKRKDNKKKYRNDIDNLSQERDFKQSQLQS